MINAFEQRNSPIVSADIGLSTICDGQVYLFVVLQTEIEMIAYNKGFLSLFDPYIDRQINREDSFYL